MRVFYILIFAIFTSNVLAGDMNIEISWKGERKVFNYVEGIQLFHKEGEVETVFSFDFVKRDYYFEQKSFLGLFKYSNEYKGKFKHSVLLKKKKGGDFYLTGEKALLTKANRETPNYSKVSLSKRFSYEDAPKCLEKDERFPTLKVCMFPKK